MSVYYPPLGFHFRVEFDLAAATEADIRFREVDGLTAELEVETVVQGGENRFAYKLPSSAKYSDLVLKRGMLIDSGIRKWVEGALVDHVIEPTTVWVTLMNEAHEPLKSFTVHDAWPKKWQVSAFNAEASELVVETLELAYTYFSTD